MKTLMSILILFLLASTAYADTYVSFKGGGSMLGTQENTTSSGNLAFSTTNSITKEFDTGFALIGAIGYDFGDNRLGNEPHFRVEIEGLHVENGNGKTTTVKVVRMEVPCENGNKKQEICRTNEVETNHKNGDGGTNKKDFIFINAIFDMPFNKLWEVYFGGGYAVSKSSTWQIMTGVAYNLTTNWSAITEFKVVMGTNDYSNKMLLLGLRYDF